MIKGLALTPPVLGRISIGKVVEKNGKRLPEKDDQFTITSQVQNKDGWVLHPTDEALRTAANGKLRSIPIKVLFNDPDLNLRAEYSSFNRQTGRPICVGDGENCKRFTAEGLQSLPCPSPSMCEFGSKAGCKPYGRLTVLIDGQDDELGCFVFRTTGFNSIRTLAARLSYFKAVSGNLLSCLPLEMKLRGKSTTQSHRAPVYYVDLTIRDGKTLDSALAEAKATFDARTQVGHNQEALDEAARLGFANGAFEESEDEVPAVLEEFFPEEFTGSGKATKSLQDKLDSKTNAGQEGGSQ